MEAKSNVKIFKIEEKDEYLYRLRSDKGEIVTLGLNFLDIDVEPKEKDYIYINAELVNPKYEGYSTFYTFGDMKSIEGRDNLELDDVDVIKLIISGKEIYLKRLYG